MIGSLCTGYGGLDLAAEAATGQRTLWVCDNDPAAARILTEHFPDCPNLRDLTAVDWSRVEPVDILTAGYPCQPFSHAGQRRGTDDERHLWPYVADAVRLLRPRLVILENVAGHLSLGFGCVVADLAALRYDARWVRVRAADVGAPHGRARVFIAANPTGEPWRVHDGDQLRTGRGERRHEPATRGSAATDTRCLPGEQGRLTTPRQEGSGWALDQFAGRDRTSTADTARVDEWPVATGNRGGQPEAPPRDGGSPPADAARVGRGERRTQPAGRGGRPETLIGSPTPADPASAERGTPQSEHLGPRPATATEPRERPSDPPERTTDWGPYRPAIHRWEAVTGRPAPAPTKPGRAGQPQLNPAFVEWMMGLPQGWVTDLPIGRKAQLKALGNGVVPQQAELALRLLGVGPIQGEVAS